MKKDKYSRDFVDRILADPEYYVLFFAHLAKINKKFSLKVLASGTLVCLCPLHKEQTPSFKVFVTRGPFIGFKCFGCGKPGTIMTLLQSYYQISFIKAVKKAITFKPIPDGYHISKDPDQLVLEFPDEKSQRDNPSGLTNTNYR